MATAQEYAAWLRNNSDKRGSPDYQTVLRAFQEASLEELKPRAAPIPEAPKESTVLGEIARGGKQLVSTTRTGIGALISPEEAARAGVERSQQIAAEAGEGPSFAALRKAYEERGLLPAAGELISQIPRAVAGQLPQLAAMAGGAKLGAMAGTAVLPGAGTLVGGALGAGATLLPQFFGANVERQAAEQMERGEPVSIDRTSAAAAAAGQAVTEAAGTAFVLGKRMVKGVLGIADDAGLATAKARAELVKAAERSRLGAAGRGAAVGLAEIPVEVAQAVIERAQAGLDVLSPEAFTEYGENAYLAGLVGPALGAATRVTAPGAARKKLAIEEQAKAAEERKATAAAEEAKKQSPEYLLDLEQRYKDAQTKKAQLDAAAVKPPKGADPATMVAHRDAVRARDEFAKTEMATVAREYASRKKDIDALNAQRQQEAETAAAKEVPQAEQKLPFYEAAQATIPGLEAVEAPAPTEEQTLRAQLERAQQVGDTEQVQQLQQQLRQFAAPDYAAQVRNLRGYLDDLRERAQGTTDLDAKLRLGEEYTRVQTALKEAEKETKAEGQGAEKRVESLRKKMAVAEEQGDIDAQVSIAKELKALGVTDLGAQAEFDLGKPQPLGKLKIPTDLADYRAEQQRVADEAAAREEQKRQQQQLAREAYERSLQTTGLYADVATAEQRKAADRAAAEAETRAEAERTQREEELVGKLVEATGAVQQQPAPQARVALPTAGTREDTYDAATELRARLAFAQQTRNKTLEANIKRQLDQLGAAPEEARGSALELGEMAREAGVEGALTPEAMEQNRLSRLAQRQLLSYDQLVKHINRAREREQTAVDEKTKAHYKYRAEQLKQAALGFAVQEINGRRQQYGLPVLEQKEVMRAVTGLARPLNELIARGAQMFEEPVVVRGQQRGIRLVQGAQEFERPPAGRRTFPEAGFTSAADTLREQFRETVEKISGKPSAPPPRPGKPPGPIRKVVPEQRELFLTPPPAEEPVSLAPTALLDKGIDKAVSAEDARLLRQMQEVYTSLTPEQQSVVREQAQRAADGKPLDAVYEMRGLYQLRQREAATAAGQTTFLKPITLVTARRKIERLAQQAAELAKEVREKLEPLIRGGVTRGLPELEYATKAAQAKAFVEKVAAGKKTDIERAQAAFDRAREQGKDLIDTAQQIRNARARELAQFSEYVYTPLLNKQRQLNSAWDEATAEFTKHQFEYDDLRAAFDAGRAPKTNRAELETLSRLIPQTAARVVEISKQLDDINNRVVEAERVLSEIRERQAADTVTNSLLKEATKAQNKIETAQQKLAAAREAEKAAERAHNAVVGEVEKAPTPLEQIEALPVKEVTRVFRDTSDPAVQAQATKKRSAIAREEGSYALLEERLKKAEGKDKVALQRQLNESQERLQNLHNELYDVYNNAPLKRVQGKTPEAAASAERLEKARHEVHDAEINAFNAQHDTARLSLPARKAGPVISEKGVVKQAGEKVVKAEPETPIADIAKTRLRLAEIAQQLTYIKENKATSKEGKAKQAKAKDALTKEKTTLSARLRELLKQQTLVKKEEQKISQELKEARTEAKAAIRRGKLEATDAQLFEDLAKATKTKEQTLLFERAENAFAAMAATEQAFVRKQANAIVGRREADYKGEALAAIVTAAERRMEREGEDIKFSRGKPVDSLTAAQVTEELERALGQKGLLGAQNVLTVVDTVADLAKLKGLSKELKAQLDAIPDDAKGFVYKGRAYLIAENIGKDHALGVLLHEVGAHIGFRNFFNPAQYNALVETVKRWSRSKANTLEARIGRAAMERVQAAQTPEAQVNDELLAYAVEEAFNAGVEPSGVKGGSAIQNWLRMLVDGFKRALEKFGLAPEKLKVGDLVNMAYGAANLELRGTWHGTGKPFKEFDFAYMGQGEGAQVYGWGTYRAQAHSTAKYYQKQEAEKQLRQWQNDPKIKAWAESLTENITFNGRKLSAERDELQKRIQSDDPEISRRAFAETYVFDLLAQRARENGFSLSPAEIAKNIVNTGELTGMDKATEAEAKKVVRDIREGKIKVVMPFVGDLFSSLQKYATYYKNTDYLSSQETPEVWMVIEDLVEQATDKAKNKTYADITKELRRLYAETLDLYEDLGMRSTYFKERTELLRSIDVDAIVYHPLPETPIPEPKGAFARVMSVRPDEEYYVLDLPLNKQSLHVQNAIAAILDSDNLIKDKTKLRKALDEKTDSNIRVNDIARALRVIPAKPVQPPPRKAPPEKLRTYKDISYFLRSYGISGYKYLDAGSRDKPIGKDSKFNYVDFYDKDEGPAIVAWDINRVGPAEDILFSRNLPTASRVAGQLIASQPSEFKRLKDNFFGWGFRAQFVDKLDPLLKAFKLGGVEDLKATQAMYYMRMYDQRMHFTSQAITEGAPEVAEKTRKDGRTERIIETKPGANIGQVVNILKRKDVVKAAGSADAANKLFTLYMAAIRGERVGYDKLNFGRTWAQAEIGRIESQLASGRISPEERTNLQTRKRKLEEKLSSLPTEADIKAAKAEIEANATLKNAFDEARDIYNQYNRNLLDFAVQTGAMAKDLANRLLAQNDYIPYYRMREGVAELVIGNETPIRIGNLKDSPHLKELVGGDEAIFDFLTSSVQNTSMLLDMSLKNLATKNAMFELRDVGLAKIGKVTKKSSAPEGAVTFKKDGEDYFAIVDTDAIGVNSELLVKGMAGIPTMFPAFVRVMGIPARFLRRTIVASPVYMARQLFRDTTAAAIASGADIVPVLGALRQLGKPGALKGRGITGGQTLTGMPEDMTRILKDMQSGKISLNGGLAWLEAQSAKVDAATRKNQYDSYIAQGLSEMEATYMALESMNFSKRGLSPGLHMLSTIIPFFNAQIQGLDVLYKAFTGQMPMNERLAIRDKLWTRGMMLAGLSFAYAMAMQDDETYQNAKPEEKYGNWFVKVPGFDQMVRLPIPFELGYIFKALPEAMVNIALNEKGGEEAAKALKHIVQQMIPGASSYFMPAAIKPALEVAMGTSMYTGRGIESAEEQAQEPGYRYRDNTTELARQAGELTGFSPIKMEYLVRGYTGSMGMALLQMLSAPFGSTGPEAAAKRLSDLPVVGTLFQPNDASGIINATYERINEINRVKETYEGLLKKGRIEDARKYLDENVNEMALASVAGSFKQYMGEITKYEGAIRAAPGMTGEEKREKLDQLRQVKINLAKAVRGSVDKKEPQAAPA